MVRLRDKRTGVIVQVDEVTAARLGGSHEPVEEPAETPVSPATRRKK